MELLHNIVSKFRKNASFAGTWNGYYRYGSDYGIFLDKKAVRFVAQITVKGNRIQGTIKEDSSGIPEVATMEGKLKGDKIVFDKIYSKGYFIDKDGSITKSQFGPQVVMYSGVFDKKNNRVHGSWKIHAKYTFTDGSEKEKKGTGYWEMTKRE